jgi:hypothetical protein
MTTQISADVGSLYRSGFLLERTQTGSRQTAPGIWPRADVWHEVVLTLPPPSSREAAIIRFYEDVLAELQIELARYKSMVSELLSVREEALGEHSLGEPNPLPWDLRRKWMSATQAGLPFPDDET